MSRLWIAFDCETTGLLPATHLIEIGAVAFRENGMIEGEFQRFVRPPIALPKFIVDLTGITDDMLRNAAMASAVLEQFVGWVPSDAMLVSHNIKFDLNVLAIADRSWFLRLHQRSVDSLDIARCLGEFPNNRLSTIARILCPAQRQFHRALDDAHVVCKLMLHAFSRRLQAREPRLFNGFSACQMISMPFAADSNPSPSRSAADLTR